MLSIPFQGVCESQVDFGMCARLRMVLLLEAVLLVIVVMLLEVVILLDTTGSEGEAWFVTLAVLFTVAFPFLLHRGIILCC